MAKSGYIAEFDGLRAIAIFLVIVYHGFVGTPLGDSFIKYVHIPVAMGWAGVDLFFVLSGFLITHILLQAKGSEHFFKNFYMRRTVRIFPLYYFYLVLFMFLVPQIFLHPELELQLSPAWFFLYASNIYTAAYGWPPDIFGHLWSLAVEEQFYLVWPLAVAYLSRRSLCWFIAALLVAVPLFRLFIALNLPNSPVWAYVMLPTRMDSLACGALLATISTRGYPHKLPSWMPVSFMSLGAILFFSLFAFENVPTYERSDPVVQTLVYSAFAFFFGGLVGFVFNRAGEDGVINKILSLRVLVSMGKISYGIYVYHMVIDWSLRELGLHPAQYTSHPAISLLHGAAFVVVLLILSYGVAYLSWHLFEKHFLKLKKYFPYADRKPTIQKPPVEERGREPLDVSPLEVVSPSPEATSEGSMNVQA